MYLGLNWNQRKGHVGMLWGTRILPTSHILYCKNTQGYGRIFYISIIFVHSKSFLQDMAWGTKVVKFSSGEKVKIGNIVLEATKSGIIRDYVKTTRIENRACDGESRINIFKKRTYLRWLQVLSLWKNILILNHSIIGGKVDKKCCTGRAWQL